MALPLTATALFKGEVRGAFRRRASIRKSLEVEDFINLLHGSDLVKVELNRLENDVRDKDRELGEAHAKIKASWLSERAREKAVEEALTGGENAYFVTCKNWLGVADGVGQLSLEVMQVVSSRLSFPSRLFLQITSGP